MLEQWKRAVIHLECATDSEHFYDRIKRIDIIRKQLERGEITHEQFGQELSGRSRDIRCHGTALFVKHDKRRYLLTARHVVFDELSAKREFQEEENRVSSWPENAQASLLQSAFERASECIFNMIFRVPTLDEIKKTGADTQREFLMNLGAGGPMAYTFSLPELDLAIISLDQRNSRFADELIHLGYCPIDSENIIEQPTCEGCEVFTVGYPSSTALIGQVSQHPATAHWSSSHFSLPVFAFGRISMLHEELPFYWADMSIYPGNSGGPIIQDGKLVGVVSAQATLSIDDVPDVRTRIPFGKIIKSKYIVDLLRKQSEKDTQWTR